MGVSVTSKSILTTFNQNGSHIVLVADDIKQSLVSLSEAGKGIVISECRTEEHDVTELAAEWATELVHEKLPLSRPS